MLYKLYSQGSVRSLDDPVTNYQFDFSVKNPFNNAPITLRWVLKLYSFLHITFRSKKPTRNLSKALKVSKVILLIEQFSYDLEKCSFRKCSSFVLSANGWKDPNLASWPLCFPAKENCNIEKALFDWPIVLQYEVKAKYRLNSRKVLGMKFFFTRAFVQPAKSYPRLYPFNKPIKSLYFRSFVVSFFFARFHFKDMRKSLYRSDFTDSLHRIVQVYQGRRHVFQIQRIISVLILKIRWYKDWRIQLY